MVEVEAGPADGAAADDVANDPPVGGVVDPEGGVAGSGGTYSIFSSFVRIGSEGKCSCHWIYSSRNIPI